MATTVANMVAKITANASGLKKTLDKSSRDIYEFKRDADAVMLEKVEPPMVKLEKVESQADIIRGIQEESSKISSGKFRDLALEANSAAMSLSKTGDKMKDLNRAMSTLRGGGAVAGITAAIFAADRMTDSLVELIGKVHNGELSFREFGASIAKSIPILGSFLKLAEDLSRPPAPTQAAIDAWDNYQREIADALNSIQAAEDAIALSRAGNSGREEAQFRIDIRRIQEKADAIRNAGRDANVQGASGAADSLALNFERAERARLEAARSAQAAAAAEEELARQQKVVNEAMEDGLLPAERLAQYIDEVNAAYRALHGGAAASGDDLDRINRAIEKKRQDIFGKPQDAKASGAQNMLDDLIQKTRLLGKTEFDAMRDRAASIGATGDEYNALLNAIAEYQRAVEVADKATELEGVRDWTNGLLEGIKTPIEKMQDFIDKLQKARKAGFINHDEFKKLIDEQEKILGLVEETNAARGFSAPGAAERGTAEAFSAETRTRQSGPWTDLLAKEKEAVDLAKNQLRQLQEIKRNTDGLDFDVRNGP